MAAKSVAKTRKPKDPCAALKQKLKERDAELKEAREQQAAVSDILRVISGTATDVKPVLRSIAEHAMRLCQSIDARVWLVEGDRAKYVTGCGSIAPPKPGETVPLDRKSGHGRAIVDRKAVHIRDAASVSQDEFPTVREFQRRLGHRTLLAVPLMCEKRALGVIVLRKMVVEPFMKRQIELVRTFADQAAIAIENVRLYEEVQVRNAELTESLEQQTATSDILRIISSSPTDTQPVFDAIARSGVRLFRGLHVALRLVNGDRLEQVASTLAVDRNFNLLDDESFPAVRAVRRGKTVNIADMSTEAWVNAEARRRAKRRGNRALALAPMLRGNDAIGVIIVSRATPGLFTDKETALLTTFADQAVIAIENVRLFKELQARNGELTQSLEQQTATSDILGVISRSPTDVAPVFETILKNAANLCGSPMAAIFRFDGELVHIEGTHNFPPEVLALLSARYPSPPNPALINGRVILSKSIVRESDALSDPDYDHALAVRGTWRRVLGVPLLRDGEPIGLINLAWSEPGETPEYQVELLKTFASQAVIAIENVRLFNETKEALEAQTATADILRVISGSPTNIQPVFDAILEKAIRLCDAHLGHLGLYDGEKYQHVAQRGASAEYAKFLSERGSYRPPSGGGLARMIAARQPIHVRDRRDSSDYRDGFPGTVALVDLGGARTYMLVPMLKEGRVVGAISIYRPVVQPFTQKQIDLVSTFANQAVIAIENVRLFNETKEALEQQTVISEILRVISSSPTDTQPVFDAVVKSGVHLFGGMDINLRLVRGDHTETVASTLPLRSGSHEHPVPLSDNGSPTSLVIQRREVVQVSDVFAEKWVGTPVRQRAEQRGFRAIMGAPLLRENNAIGSISVTRATPGPFSDKQVALLKTFADQAVIAIENVRLFKELQARNADLTESLDRQTATAEILRVISSSPTDIQPVLDAVAASAARLCNADDVVIRRFEGDLGRIMAHIGSIPVQSGGGVASLKQRTVMGTLSREGKTIHIPDVTAPEAREKFPDSIFSATGRWGVRTMLSVPLLREGAAIGAIILRRLEVRPFSDKQIELLETFAAQAVIAIENVRLFKELEARNRELTQSLEQQTATSDILGVISRSPTDVAPVFETIMKNAANLCGSPMAAIFRFDGELVHIEGTYNWPPEALASFSAGFPSPPNPALISGRVILSKSPVRESDVLSDPGYDHALAVKGTWRRMLGVPLLRDGEPIGLINLGWTEPGETPEYQVELLKTFASQAVIAIENVRLFKALQARNAEITEALEQQTATSEILRVISSSPTDIQPVLDAVAESAARLCDAADVIIRRVDGDVLTLAAHIGPVPDRQGAAPLISRRTFMCRAVRECRTIHVHDVLEPHIREEYPDSVGFLAGGRYRTVLVTPLMREGTAIGAIVIRRPEMHPFSDKQIKLLETFADQAVIAIENVRLFKELQARNAEVTEALEQQTATSEILSVISQSPTDVAPVFETIMKNAVRLCGGPIAAIYRFDGELVHLVATHNWPPEALASMSGRYPCPPSPALMGGRSVLAKSIVCVPDAFIDPDYDRSFAAIGHWRRMVGVPLMRGETPVGAFAVGWPDPGETPESQVALLKTFADQAVIAIENVRLFKELQARNAEISEALEQQTATAEILSVISSSPTDLKPVFDAILENATRLCDAHMGLLGLYDGEKYQNLAQRGASAEYAKYVIERGPFRPSPGSGLARMIAERQRIHVADRRDTPEYRDRDPGTVAMVELGGARTYITVPMLKEGRVVGGIAIYRPEVRPFSQKQIDLVSTFANQAVIAIENVRLFNETKEALEQQTVISEILRIISSSPTDTQPVFDAIVRSGSELFGGLEVYLRLVKGDQTEIVAASDPALFEGARYPTPLNDDSRPSARAILRREVIHVPDIFAEEWVSEETKTRSERRDRISRLYAPLMRGNNAVGVIAVTRPTAGPFSDKQVALLKTFADQAVIAIENVRLFKELQARNAEITEALEQQTATAEILKVISSSPTDIQPVFEAILDNAMRLCGAHMGVLRMQVGNEFRRVAQRGVNPQFASWIAEEAHKHSAPTDGAVGQMIAERRPVHILDRRESPAYRRGNPTTVALVELGGARTFLAVPMLKDGRVVGGIMIFRPVVQAFTQKQIDLLSTFADQAVIAIENVRLFKELQAKNAEVTEALEQQTATGEVLKVISRSTFDLDPVLETLVENARKLCDADTATISRADKDGNYAPVVVSALEPRPDYFAYVQRHPIRPDRATAVGRAVLDRRAVHIPDVLADPAFTRTDLAEVRGFRTVLAVPMLREGEPVGVFVLTRTKEVRPFTEKQIELVTTFADQAVIAIENVRLFNEIQDKSLQLEVANRHKSQFLANMSHELRTPLNCINGFSEMLLARMFGDVNEKQEEFLRDINSSGEHLLSLINDVLDLSKIEAGRMELHITAFEPGVTLDSTVMLVKERAASRGITVSLQVDEKLDRWVGDERKIRQVMLNLLSNSVKFTPEGGRIDVRARREGNDMVVAVSDTGIGIRPEDQARIFEEFQQAGTDYTKKAEGTGLGLALSRKFVELHGGTLRVESAERKGSTFTFTLPEMQEVTA